MLLSSLAKKRRDDMAKVSIDGLEYDTDKLPEALVVKIKLLRAADREIEHLNLQLSLAQISRNALAIQVKNDIANLDRK
jgi:hypothetical protein